MPYEVSPTRLTRSNPLTRVKLVPAANLNHCTSNPHVTHTTPQTPANIACTVPTGSQLVFTERTHSGRGAPGSLYSLDGARVHPRLCSRFAPSVVGREGAPAVVVVLFTVVSLPTATAKHAAVRQRMIGLHIPVLLVHNQRNAHSANGNEATPAVTTKGGGRHCREWVPE